MHLSLLRKQRLESLPGWNPFCSLPGLALSKVTCLARVLRRAVSRRCAERLPGGLKLKG